MLRGVPTAGPIISCQPLTGRAATGVLNKADNPGISTHFNATVFMIVVSCASGIDS
jgi:hypothetical protein